MAVVRQQFDGLLPQTDPEAAAFSQFFGSMAANPAVERIAIDPHGDYIDMWVRMTDDSEAYEFGLYEALDLYHATDGVKTPIDLHLILANEPDRFFPSKHHLMYQRRP